MGSKISKRWARILVHSWWFFIDNDSMISPFQRMCIIPEMLRTASMWRKWMFWFTVQREATMKSIKCSQIYPLRGMIALLFCLIASLLMNMRFSRIRFYDSILWHPQRDGEAAAVRLHSGFIARRIRCVLWKRKRPFPILPDIIKILRSSTHHIGLVETLEMIITREIDQWRCQVFELPPSNSGNSNCDDLNDKFFREWAGHLQTEKKGLPQSPDVGLRSTSKNFFSREFPQKQVFRSEQ